MWKISLALISFGQPSAQAGVYSTCVAWLESILLTKYYDGVPAKLPSEVLRALVTEQGQRSSVYIKQAKVGPFFKIKGEERHYYSEVIRREHLTYFFNGRLYDSKGKLLCRRGPCRGMFVMSEVGAIYFQKVSRFGKQPRHTYFLAGEPVSGAGNMTIFLGKIESFSNESGHYHPNFDVNRQVLAEILRNGMPIPQNVVVYSPDHTLETFNLSQALKGVSHRATVSTLDAWSADIQDLIRKTVEAARGPR